jgi:ParB family chromosome partitioning protein
MSALADVTPGNTADDQPPASAAPATDQPASATPAVAPRPAIPVALLTAHPGNVRRDLDLSPDFLASIQANGVLVPLRITSGADGAFRVIDGHRRLAAAVQTGLAEVPADLASDRAGDEPGQFLDMWNAHRHRNPLTPIEEADALFAAREAGATKARIRKSTGLKPPEINAALTAARLCDDTRATVEAMPYELTLEDLAVIAEFEGDPDAVAKLLDTARWGGTLNHQAERLRQERADNAEQERLCRQLEDVGINVTPALPPGGQLLTALCHDGEEITPESHVGCPGRGAFFRSYDPTTPIHYCADPATCGHSFPDGDPGTSSSAAGATDTPGPAGQPDPGPPDAARRLVIQGNKAWKAAAEVRKRWLATHLFPRRTVPREASQFVARQLLAMPDPLRSGLATAHSRLLFTEITGQPAAKWQDACDTAAIGRLPLLMLAPIVTAYEQAMAEGEGKNTWRPDRYSPCPRNEAGRYLTLLASLGYQLSDIEQAVAGDVPYTGDSPRGDFPPGSSDGDTANRPDRAGPDDESAHGGADLAGDAVPGNPDGRPDGTGDGAA